MVDNQVIGPFITTNHFCERWYERTTLPSTYLELVVEENAYLWIGDTYDGTNSYYMFSCPKESTYYVLVVADNYIKTILTEKLYKQTKGSIDMTRYKKKLRLIQKELREKWSKADLSVNGVVVRTATIKLDDDVIWGRITEMDNLVKELEEATSMPGLTEMYMCDIRVPIKPIYTYELIIADKVVFEKQIKVSTRVLKLAKQDRKSGFHSFDPEKPKNRSERRFMQKIKKKV